MQNGSNNDVLPKYKGNTDLVQHTEVLTGQPPEQQVAETLQEDEQASVQLLSSFALASQV